jgi:hypothetical protein
MGVFYEQIPDSLIKWILEQKMFWVATAPLAAAGHVNISPKGGEYFGVIDNKTFWYMELTGSGSETLAHLYERGNARITVLFNAFDGPPKIARLFGKGRLSVELRWGRRGLTEGVRTGTGEWDRGVRVFCRQARREDHPWDTVDYHRRHPSGWNVLRLLGSVLRLQSPSRHLE